MSVGGIGGALYNSLVAHVRQWLLECDLDMTRLYEARAHDDDVIGFRSELSDRSTSGSSRSDVSSSLTASEDEEEEEEEEDCAGRPFGAFHQELLAALPPPPHRRPPSTPRRPPRSRDVPMHSSARRRERRRKRAERHFDGFLAPFAEAIALHLCDVRTDAAHAPELPVDLFEIFGTNGFASTAPPPPTSLREWIGSRTLEAIAALEFRRCAEQSRLVCDRDALSLGILEGIAQLGVHGEEGPLVLERMRPRLLHLLRNPPPEMQWDSVVSERLGSEVLIRALNADIDAAGRARFVNEWRALHGAYASTLAAESLARLQRTQREPPAPFLRVLGPPGGRTPARAARNDARGRAAAQVVVGDDGAGQMRLRLPSTRAFNLKLTWAYASAPDHVPRTRLDRVGRRIVRLVSLVWDLSARGELLRGHVSPACIEPIARQAKLEAGLVQPILEQRLQSNTVGIQLFRFAQRLVDGDETFHHAVTDALLPLAAFPVAELVGLMHHTSVWLPSLVHELSPAVRPLLHDRDAVSHKYMIAQDALRLLMPVLHARRARLGISPLCASPGIAELMLTCPRVREWQPEHGTLVLRKRDLAAASPTLKVALTKMVEHKSRCVARKRVSVNGRQEGGASFVFDTLLLARMLRGLVRIS